MKIIRTLFIKLGFLPRKKALSGGIDAGRSRFSSPPNQPKSTNKTVLRKINEWWLTRKPAKKSAQIEIKRGIFSPRTLWLLWLGTAGMVGFWLFSSIDGSSLVQRALAHIDLFKIVVVSVEEKLTVMPNRFGQAPGSWSAKVCSRFLPKMSSTRSPRRTHG